VPVQGQAPCQNIRQPQRDIDHGFCPVGAALPPVDQDAVRALTGRAHRTAEVAVDLIESLFSKSTLIRQSAPRGL